MSKPSIRISDVMRSGADPYADRIVQGPHQMPGTHPAPCRAHCGDCRSLLIYGCPLQPPACQRRTWPGGPGCSEAVIQDAEGGTDIPAHRPADRSA